MTPSDLHIVPSIHPAFILRRNARFQGVFEWDLKRAIGIAKGAWKSLWQDKNYILKPTLKQVLAFFAESTGKVAFDIETDGGHPLNCQIRCIAFYCAATKKGLCVPLLYRDGGIELKPASEAKKSARKERSRRFAESLSQKGLSTRDGLTSSEGDVEGTEGIESPESPEAERQVKVRRWVKYWKKPLEEKAVLAAMQKFLCDRPDVINVTQNGQFDRLCISSMLGFEPKQGFDTMVAHHVVASFFPHGLGFLTSMYTDLWYYKSTADGSAWSSENDDALFKYACRDCKVTVLAAEKIEQEVNERPEDIRIYEHDMWQELQCQRWKATGVTVDLIAMRQLREHYKRRGEKAYAEIQKIVGERITALDVGFKEDVFRPGSLPELRGVLEALGVPLTTLTATGQISTAKELLVEARLDLVTGGVKPNDARIAFLDFLFEWRESTKVVSTFLQPEISADGRMHTTFYVHVTPTGRLSSSDPINFQNQPKEIRGMYVAAPGYKLVSGDWDSLELRLAGLLSGEQTFIKAFALFDAGKGPKIHYSNAQAIFGLPKEKITEPLYRAGKLFAYGVLYGSGPKTVFEQCSKEMPDLDFDAFLVCYRRFKEARPTLFTWQRALIARGLKNGYLDSPLLKRRRYFFERADEDSPEAAAMLNFPNQSGAADTVGLANRRVVEKVCTLKKYREVRQLAQVHDELLFEVPNAVAEAFGADFKRVAEEPPEGTDWKLPVSITVSDRWAKLEIKEAA